MKTFSLIVLAIIIGSSNAFAINELPDNHLYKMKPPVKNLFFDTINPVQDEVIAFNENNNCFEAKIINQSIVYENICLTDDFTANLNNNSDKISKIRDYALLMPEIITKE